MSYKRHPYYKDLYSRVQACTACPLHACRTGPGVIFRGNSESSIMFLGQCPGKVEEALGDPFIGPAGELLEEWMSWADIDINDLYITNTVKCRPVAIKGSGRQNIDPTLNEISTCSNSFLAEEINRLNPKLIIACGKIAAFALGALSSLSQSVSKLTGKTLDLEFAGGTYQIFFLRHPAALLHAQNGDQDKIDILVQEYIDCFTELGTKVKAILSNKNQI